jgi:hypothetical protein
MTNLSTNPSFSGTNNTDITKPGGGTAKDSLRQGGGGVVTGTGNAVVYRDTYRHTSTESRSWPISGNYSLCIDAGSAISNDTSAKLSGSATTNLSLWGMVAGGTYTVSAYMYQDTIQTGTLNAFARSIKVNITAPSVNGGSPVDGWVYAQAHNTTGVQRVSTTFTLPADVTSVDILLTNGANTGKVWWDGLLIDTGRKLNKWFDKDTIFSINNGGSSEDYRVDTVSDRTYVYVKPAMRFGGGGSVVGNSGGLVYRQTSYPTMNSKYSLVVDTVGSTDNNTCASLGGVSSGSMGRLGIVAGKEYTISGDICVPTAQTGTLHQYARSIVLVCTTPSGSVVFSSGQGAVEGLSRVSLTASIPTDTTNVMLYLYNGVGDRSSVSDTGGQVVYWDNVRICSTTDSTYVDGDSLGYSWGALEHASVTNVSAVVYNSTPEFTWTVSGGTQKFREVFASSRQ